MTTNKHIIFDLDGTLINSIPIMEKAWKDVQSVIGIATPFSEYKKYIGLPFELIMEKLNLSNLLNEIHEVYFDATKKRSREIGIINGASEIVNFLKKKNFVVSIITSKPRKSFETIKSIIPNNIDYIICSDDTKYKKPDKNLIGYLLKKFPNDLKNLTYVGDTIFDLEFSVNSGIDFIFFSNHKKNKLPTNLLNKIKSVDELIEIKFFF